MPRGSECTLSLSLCQTEHIILNVSVKPRVSCCSVTLNPCKSAVVNNPADNGMQNVQVVMGIYGKKRDLSTAALL